MHQKVTLGFVNCVNSNNLTFIQLKILIFSFKVQLFSRKSRFRLWFNSLLYHNITQITFHSIKKLRFKYSIFIFSTQNIGKLLLKNINLRLEIKSNYSVHITHVQIAQLCSTSCE